MAPSRPGTSDTNQTLFTKDRPDDLEKDLEKQPPVADAGVKEIDPSHLVTFEPNDPENPKNWPRWQRWYYTMFSGILVFNATFASSAPTGVIEALMPELHESLEVAILPLSLFVGGYCVGPFVWAPLSEQYGRRPLFIIAFFVYTCFQVGSALAPNTGALLAFRFIGGTFAACPLTNSGGLIADIWDADTRGDALAIFTLAPFAGPSMGPIVGGFIFTAGVSWRWVFWVLTIFAGACLVLLVFTIPETYAPVILAQKAARLRKQTGDNRYYAQLEIDSNIPLSHRLEKIFARPFKILFREPMLIAVTLYMSFVYGCVYMLFEAYPIVFGNDHGLNAGLTGLTFIPVFLGGVLGVLCYLFIFNPRYGRLIERYKPDPVPPEARLECSMWGAPLLVVAFFWFGWTSYSHVSIWAPIMSGLVMGIAVLFIFLALFNYIIDAYLFAAASALASSTVVRSLAGATFPLFSNQMFDALNPRWASSLFGFIALAMVPIPLVLIKYGPALRAKSKYAKS